VGSSELLHRGALSLGCGGSGPVLRSEAAARRTAVAVDREEEELEDRKVEEIVYRGYFCKIGID
jgi:hypothetical protein